MGDRGECSGVGCSGGGRSGGPGGRGVMVTAKGGLGTPDSRRENPCSQRGLCQQ